MGCVTTLKMYLLVSWTVWGWLDCAADGRVVSVLKTVF